MDLRDFLGRVTPPGNKYAAQLVAHSSGNKYFRHTNAANHDDLTALIRKFAANRKMDETYFALSSFRMALVEATNGTMRPHRKQENVDRIKALWVDVDVGPTKDYTSRKDAVEAMRKWLLDEHIYPPTIIVDSGGGYHLYWTFTEAVVPSRWKPMAEALKASGQKAGFNADWKCTVDSARVLRPPETINWKEPGNPRKVTVVQSRPDDIDPNDMARNLQRYMTASGTGLGQGPGVGNANEALSAGIYHAERKYRMGPIVQQCPVMTHVADTHGKDSAEPFWMAALQLAVYCEDGKDWIHALSDGHPDYVATLTEAKYQKLVDIKDTIGPTICKNFEDHHPAGCASCPFRGRLTSPITLGDKEEGSLPWPYTRDNGKIYRDAGTDKDGNPKPPQLVCNFDVEDVQLGYDEEGILCTYFEQILSATHKEFRKLRVEDLTINNPGLSQSRAGVYIPEQENRRRFAELMVTFTAQLQKGKQQIDAKETIYGWAKRDKQVGFSMNGNTYWEDGNTERTNRPKGGLSEQYEPCGTEKMWVDTAAKMKPTMTPELELLLATTFAAPLVSLVAPYSTIMSFRSNATGVGKTLVLKLAQAVWGHPSKSPMMLTDTVNAIASIMGSMGNYPSYWDEVRIHSNVQAGLDLIMQVGQGREKRRLTAGSELKNFGSWHSMLVLTTNESIIDHIQNSHTHDDAALARTFEIEVKGATKSNDFTLNNAVGSLNSNYGKVGRRYAKYLVDNHAAVQSMIDKTLAKLQVDPAMDNNRFAGTTLAALLVGAAVAKGCGIYDFNLLSLRTSFVDALRVTTDSEADVDLLVQYLQEHQHQRLILKDKAAPGPNNKVTVLAPPMNSGAPIAYQVVRDEQTLYVPRTALNKYGYRAQLSGSQIKDEMVEKHGAVVKRLVMGGGTLYSTPQAVVYAVPIAGALEGLLSGVS